MPDENVRKSRYTEAQKKAAEKYLKESVEDIRIRVPKGQKDVIKAHAQSQGESVNGFIGRAISETMERDKAVPEKVKVVVQEPEPQEPKKITVIVQEPEPEEPKKIAVRVVVPTAEGNK